MSDDSNDRTGGRPIKNIKGLLKFCMEATKSEDAQGSRENMEPMSEERRKWLEEALTSMTVSPAERMTACLALIEAAQVDTTEGTDQQIQALTELEDWAQDFDIAGDFIKLNGARIVPGLLTSEVSEIRWRCLELLANLSQNHPKVQTALLSLQLMPVMLHLLDTDPNPTVRVKALYAISCLVRGHSESESHLLSGEGLDILIRSLASEEEKLKLKATFLISTLCTSNPAFKDVLTDKGIVEHLVRLLKEEEHGAVHEHFMSALLSVVEDNAKAKVRCLDSSLDLKSFLCQRSRMLEGKEEFEEEKDHAEKILSILNNQSTQSSGSASSNPNRAMMLA